MTTLLLAPVVGVTQAHASISDTDAAEQAFEELVTNVRAGLYRVYAYLKIVQMSNYTREGRNEQQLITDNAVAFISVLELEGTLIEANQPELDASGLARGGVISKKFWQTPW